MKKYTKKQNIIIATIIVLVGFLAGSLTNPGKEIIKYFKTDVQANLVSSVTDGDTFKIENNQRVRIIGIDAPEKGECYFNESTQALKDLIENKLVRLEKEISEKDKYDRLLRHVILPGETGEDNINVAQYLVENGFVLSIASPPDNRYRNLLSTAQEKAKRDNVGLWVICASQIDPNYAKQEQDAGPSNPDCIIKGNISEKGYGKTYLVPGCDNYNSVKIDTRKGEEYFCTEQEAIDAGFRKATNCP